MSLATTATPGRFGHALPPEFIESNLVRIVFNDTEPGTALRLDADCGAVTLLPWSSSQGKIAAYGPGEREDVVPIELGAKALREFLDENDTASVPLEETSARHLLGTPAPRDVAVSWHARVRWAERVQEETHPAPSIHAALEEAVELARHQGWYNPALNVRIPIEGAGPIFDERLDADWVAKTVITMDDDDIGFDR